MKNLMTSSGIESADFRLYTPKDKTVPSEENNCVNV
jgi:hypothetical protein